MPPHPSVQVCAEATRGSAIGPAHELHDADEERDIPQMSRGQGHVEWVLERAADTRKKVTIGW